MKELVASIVFSALRNLFHKQPDLSAFTTQTYQREPNLSFHLANELWPYLFWLQCDCDVTKPNANNRRPDIIFHRRGIHALNFLVVEVKCPENPEGTGGDVTKLRDAWFGKHYTYRFGASVLMDAQKKEFLVQLLENASGQLPDFTQANEEYWLPIASIEGQRVAVFQNLVVQIAAAEKAEMDTRGLKHELDQQVRALYRGMAS